VLVGALSYTAAMAKAGTIDDPVWAEPGPTVVHRAPGKGTNRHPWRYVVALIIVVGLLVGGLILFTRGSSSGDPGGRILDQLVPADSALPGYGTPSLPWRTEPSLSQPYLIKTEPFGDSCDGRPGTQGWSDVVVQAGFSWSGTSDALIASVGSRLTALGWQQAFAPSAIEAGWRKRLDNGSTAGAMLNLDPTGPPGWEFVATAPPLGKAPSGC
jgi:hypothetical protein